MYVYLLTNTVNGKQYIGQTSKTPEERWQMHINNAQGNKERSAYPLYHAIRKYGRGAFTVSVLDTALTQAELNEKERDYIYAYNTMDKSFGYNRHEGGNKPPLSTPESRRKAGLAMRGKPKSEEWRRKISIANTGKTYQGHPLSPEHKEKLLQGFQNYLKKLGHGTRKGHKSSPEHVEKIRLANTGKKHSEETKRKISLAKQNPSEETRQKMRESHLRYYAARRKKE